MKSIKVKLENCYGINKLEYEFIFDPNHRTFSIYAPNGVMKTSFAKTFEDLSQGKKSQDIVFPKRKTEMIISKDNENLKPEEVFVIEPYNEGFSSSKISTLLVNQKLRDQYTTIHLDIDSEKNKLLTVLRNYSGLKNEEIEKEISKVFMQNQEGEFFKALETLNPRLEDNKGDFIDIKYNTIFSERALRFFGDADVQKHIKQYVEKYDELIAQSKYFKKGIFNDYQAEEIAKRLEQNGFFKAEHSVFLKGNPDEITTQKQLQTIIENEKNSIFTDTELKNMFSIIRNKIIKNQELRDLGEYLTANKYILSQLTNIESFKAKVWLSYLKQEEGLYRSVLETYERSKKEIAKIIQRAQNERTKWQTAVDIFNYRFYVPFKIIIENQTEVIFNDEAPTIAFEFQDRNSIQSMEKEEILKVLSQGEKRALYILNIIFEILARKDIKQETLFIIDDIADSFDYKNKYAIIEYLRDISKEDFFYQIILTHNFDFHRTVSSRLNMARSNKLNTLRGEDDIKLLEEVYQHHPFTDWKKHLNDNKKLFASIPLVRNLAEFSDDQETKDELTSFLHIKDKTKDLKLENLKPIFKKILKSGTDNINDTSENFLDTLEKVALSIRGDTEDNMKLEEKITLAIAIRLKAERFILTKINNSGDIKKNQTYKLVKMYQDKYEKDSKKSGILKILEKVLLMTPENIHINSFMYEPIIDMSGEHLKQLYEEVNDLPRLDKQQ